MPLTPIEIVLIFSWWAVKGLGLIGVLAIVIIVGEFLLSLVHREG